MIQDEASGMEVSRVTLAELLNVSPASSNFRELVASSRFYGLTNGGINADEFSLTPLGNEATGNDEVAQVTAYKQAVMNVAPYKTFFATFSNKKIPSATAFKEFLTRSASVAAERADECMQFILADARTAGLVRTPISRKVMRDECSSGIFIFTADERFVRELAHGETEEVWDRLVAELGSLFRELVGLDILEVRAKG